MAKKKLTTVASQSLFGEIQEEFSEVDYKETKLGLWDYINAITSSKKDLTDEELRWYEPYIINRWLSCSEAYIHFARMASETTLMKNKRMHFEFVQNAYPSKRLTLNKGLYVSVVDNKAMKELIQLITSAERLGGNDIKSLVDFFGFEKVNNYADRYRSQNGG